MKMKHPLGYASKARLAAAAALSGLLLGLAGAPAQAQYGGAAPLCVGNVWSEDARLERVDDRLDDAEDLGIRAVRHVVGGIALTGGGINSTRSVADDLRRRGFTALLQISPRYAEATPAEIRAGGAAWGPFLRAYADVYVHGVQVGNEPNNNVLSTYRRTLADGASERDAEVAARARAAELAGVVVAFAEGVRSTCPECRIATGGIDGRINGPRRKAAVMYLEALAPHVGSGLIAPILDVHVYRDRRFFNRDASRELRWTENFAGAVDDLLVDSGWPRTTRLQSTETNVPANDGWRSDGVHAEALEALLRGLIETPRMDLVCLYTPWGTRHSDRYQIRERTPAWDTVKRVATER